MLMNQLVDNLNMIPKETPALKTHHKSTLSLIVNDPKDNNIGYDVTFSLRSLKIVKFKRDPYMLKDIMTGYESITSKQNEVIRKHFIENFFPELKYLI